ncbi:MAG: AAA family ATPase, partial [Nocardioidaceae bacterium]
MSGGSAGRSTGRAASHARPAVRVVELLGPPASGKSSVAAGLAETPGVVVLKEHRRSDLPALVKSVVAAWPVLWTRPPAGVGRLRWAAWAGRLGAAPRTVGRRRAPRTVVLLDQGPAYTLGRMAQLRDDPLAAAWWQARMEMSAQLLDVLVVLDADTATLAHRLHARPKAHVARTLDQMAA